MFTVPLLVLFAGCLPELPGGGQQDAPDTQADTAPEEVCNGVDDDGDGEVDEGVEQAWYLDADGDGFGAGDPTLECSSPGSSYAELSGDCDDTSPDTFPDATEWCDGVQQDCADEGWQDDAGVATWVAGSGEATDLTPSLSEGVDYEPTPLLLTESGELRVCAGTWYVTIDVAVGVHLTISDPTASGGAILDGGDVAQVLQVEGGESTTVLSASDVTFTRGRSEADGGCIEIGSGAEVRLTRVQLLDCTAADRGGGFAALSGDTRIEIEDTLVTGCSSGSQGGGMMFGGDVAWWSSDTRLDRVEISDNTAGGNGGGMHLNGHTATLTSLDVHNNFSNGWGGGIGMAGSEIDLLDSAVTSNSASANGGGFYAGDQTTATITRTVISENTTTDDGGGAWVEGSICVLTDTSIFGNTATGHAGGLDLAYDGGVSSAYNRASCTGSALSASFGFAGNRDGHDTVEVRVGTGTAFTATGCDWQGSAEGEPGDVLSESTGAISSWGLDATFECGDAGCL